MSGAVRYYAASQTRAEDSKPKPVVVTSPTFVAESPDKHGRSGYDTAGGRRLLRLSVRELPWVLIHGAEPPRWSRRVARVRAETWLRLAESHKAGVLVLLGRRVCDAFLLPPDAEWLGWYGTAAHQHPMIAFPNPSPLNRWWNAPSNVEDAQRLLISLAGGELPHFDYKKKDETA